MPEDRYLRSGHAAVRQVERKDHLTADEAADWNTCPVVVDEIAVAVGAAGAQHRVVTGENLELSDRDIGSAVAEDKAGTYLRAAGDDRRHRRRRVRR